jgi:hypothetical protein
MTARLAGALAIAAFAAACHSAPRTTEITPPANRETIRNLPGWYLRPPTDNNFLFGAATAVSRDVQVAINKAQSEGRNAIAQELEVKYGSLNKRFAEEVGRGGEAQILDQYTQVYKAVVSQVLYGSRPRQQTLRTEGPVYRAVVLMELPIGEMSKKLMDQIRAQEQLYTRFRASEAFKELDAEVQKYEAWKRGQGIPR